MKKRKFVFLAFTIALVVFLVFYFGLSSKREKETNRQKEGGVDLVGQEYEESNTQIPTPIEAPYSKYPIHKNITATIFWVGEEASLDNNYTSNAKSVWDSNWVKSFGGVDTPHARNGWFPEGFTPLENPFYVALPYSDFDEIGRKGNITRIPWYSGEPDKNVSLVKNRWIKIYYKGKVCFAQWEDVGPGSSDDVDYVFGKARPINTFGLGAGVDISPAVRDFLGASSVAAVDWHFVEENEVAEGPWKLIVTTSPPNWEN